MNIIGKLLPLRVNYATGKSTILIQTAADVAHDYEELKNKENLLITIKEYKKRRTLDANSYYWVLISKLARVLKTSNSELHNLMLARYGVNEIIDGGLMRIPLPESEETEKKVKTSEYYHLRPTTEIRSGKDGKDYRTYIMMKGSHSYDTKEMADLISGLISECREAGISDNEIATPDEKAQLQEKYGFKF